MTVLESDQFQVEPLKDNKIAKVLLNENQLDTLTKQNTISAANKLFEDSKNLIVYNINNNFKI